MTKIPDEIRNYFLMADKGWRIDGSQDSHRANNHILDEQEVAYAKQHISIFIAGFNIEAGMTLEDMIKANPQFRGKCILGNKDYKPPSFISRLLGGRKKSKDDIKSIEVGQGQYAIKTYSKQYPSLQTDYIHDCVAVTIYDKKHKRGFIAHFDEDEKIYDFKNLIKQLGFNPKYCEARIIGGRTGLSEGKVELLDNILKQNKFNIVEIDVLGTKERAIQMDLNTGEVSDYQETQESVHGRDNTNCCYTPNLGKNKYSD